MPREVVVRRVQAGEQIDVERLAHAAGAVPEADPTIVADPLELIQDVGAHRGHAGASAHEHHLGVGALRRQEVAEGAGDDDLVPRLEPEEIGGDDSGRDARASRGRGRDAHVQHQRAPLLRRIRQRVRTHGRVVRSGLQAPQVETVPFVAVLRCDLEIGEPKVMRRALDLDVAAGAEVDLLAGRKVQLDLPYKGRDIAGRAHRAAPPADLEHLAGKRDGHLLPQLQLAGQTPAPQRLAPVDVHGFGRQEGGSTRLHTHAARPARAPPPARGGQEDPGPGQGREQRATGLGEDVVRPAAVDGHPHRPARGQERSSPGEEAHQDQHHEGEGRDRHEHRGHRIPRSATGGCPRRA